jgi:NAD(P) transhydrogenase
MPEKYDLIVLGSGPAGEKGAAKASYFGKRVALVEKEAVYGGASCNTGTLPSKTLRETALFLSGFQQRELFGIKATLKERVQVRDFLARERLCKEQERARVHENLKRHGIRVYQGVGSFVDPHTISVEAARCPPLQLTADVVLIATGSYPYRPANFPFTDPRVHDSDTVLTLHEIPRSLVVVGGGVIGCEYACMFAALGVQVTLIEKRPRLLDFLDEEIVNLLTQHMESAGIALRLSDGVTRVVDGPVLEAHLQSGEVVEADAMLISSGRCGNTEALGLAKIGVRTDERGRVIVNPETFQTSVPHIYAAGDVIGNPALASTSMEQARVAVGVAFELGAKEQQSPVLPYGIYTIPECSMAGETEQSLTAKKVPYVVGRASYAGNARGTIIGDRTGLLKLLFAPDSMKLLGVQMIGEQATELIHIGLTALETGANADLFVRMCFNYPTLAETYKYAAYDALGKAAR